MASSNYHHLVKYLNENYDQPYISRYARRLNGWRQDMNGAQERDHIATSLYRNGWTAQMLEDQRKGRSRDSGIESPGRNGSPPRPVRNFSGRGSEAAGTTQAAGYQPGQKLSTAEVGRALSPGRSVSPGRYSGVQQYRYDQGGLRGDKAGYGYGGRGESDYRRRGMDMPPKTASSGERIYEGSAGPGSGSMGGSSDLSQAQYRQLGVPPRPTLYDRNGQPDERGKYDRTGEYEGTGTESPNSVFTSHHGGLHRGSNTYGKQEAMARADNVAQDALARAMAKTGSRTY